MALREDAWLGAVLGRPAFALASAADAIDLREGAFYYAKLPTEQVGEVLELCASGLYVVDVNVTLARAPGHTGVRPAFEVAPLAGDDAEAVLEIAGTCFRYSRFHLDPAIPREVADRVKREWVASYVGGARGIELLVARDGSGPLGFLAVLGDDDARVIDLVGVAERAQRRGVASALVETFARRHADAAVLRVGTQAANIPSLRLYAAHGYVVERTAYVLHGHGGREA